MNGRCTLAKAFELLAPDFEPKAAADTIEHAIHTDDHFPLYCDGNVVEAGIAKHITVEPESKDGPADILWDGPGLGWAPRAYPWELDVDAALALKLQPDTRVESAQAMAITAQQKAEAATAETASMRAELEKARAEARTEAEKARAKMEELKAALQAATEQMEKEAMEGQVEAATDNPLRRKPGKKANYPLWRLEAGTFAHRFFKKNARMPSAGEVAEHLQTKCDGWEPHPTDIRDLLKLLRPD